MIRIVITQIVLFLMPFVAFFVYRLATEGRTGAAIASTGRVKFTLAMIGAVLVLAGFVYFAMSWHEQSGVYVPAQYRDGVLIPGGFRPAE